MNRISRLFLLFMLATIPLRADAGQKTLNCPDGTSRLEIDVNAVALKYHAPSFQLEMSVLSSLGLELSIDPKQVQQVSETTQNLNQMIRALVVGYNSCAISPRQYAEGLKEFSSASSNAKQIKQLEAALKKGSRQEKLALRRELELYLKAYVDSVLSFVRLSGHLIPGNKPNPPAICRIPPGALKIFFGSSVMWAMTDNFPVIRVDGVDLIRLSRIGTSVALSAQVFSDDGKIVAEIANNSFVVNRNNYFKIETPTPNSLRVYDQHNHLVLDVDYLNPGAIRLLGRFEFTDRPPIVLQEDGDVFVNWTAKNSCLGNGGVMIDKDLVFFGIQMY